VLVELPVFTTYLGNTCVTIGVTVGVNHAYVVYYIMADKQHGRFSYDSAEEDWDLPALQFVNSQLENYLKMVGVLYLTPGNGTSIQGAGTFNDYDSYPSNILHT